MHGDEEYGMDSEEESGELLDDIAGQKQRQQHKLAAQPSLQHAASQEDEDDGADGTL